MKTPTHKPPTPGQVAILRARLLAARRRVVDRIAGADEDLRAISEARENELQERPQVLAAADMIARLGEEEFAVFTRIEGALLRLASGSYGFCTRCSTPLGIARLRADPSASLCAPCARTSEDSRQPAPPREPAAEHGRATSPLPPDLHALDDAEIAALVHECFREEVGAALAGVRVACRHAVVTLGGDVASEELRQIALRIVEDEMGLETADYMRVTSLAGEAETRGDVARRRPTVIDDLGVDISDGGGISEDIFAVEEDGLAYTPPARPVAG